MTGSWRTTVAGVLTILGGVCNAGLQWFKGGLAAVDLPVLFATVAAGYGLIKAKDSAVTNSPTPVLPQAAPKS